MLDVELNYIAVNVNCISNATAPSLLWARRGKGE